MPTQSRLEKINQVVDNRQQGIVVIENIVDPHNAEAAIRSCDAFGIQHVCFIFEETKKFNPRRVGKATSSSANKWVDYSIYDTTEECISDLKSKGYEVIATVLDNEAESLYEAKIDTVKPAFLFGNEKDGLSQKAIDLADRKMYIPMRGFVQSLNISVTVSIFLFELTRRRLSSMKNFAYDEAYTTQLKEAFLER
jgi:tRNA (guanosine-2'-O-)-methyltransferase